MGKGTSGATSSENASGGCLPASVQRLAEPPCAGKPYLTAQGEKQGGPPSPRSRAEVPSPQPQAPRSTSAAPSALRQAERCPHTEHTEHSTSGPKLSLTAPEARPRRFPPAQCPAAPPRAKAAPTSASAAEPPPPPLPSAAAAPDTSLPPRPGGCCRQPERSSRGRRGPARARPARRRALRAALTATGQRQAAPPCSAGRDVAGRSRAQCPSVPHRPRPHSRWHMWQSRRGGRGPCPLPGAAAAGGQRSGVREAGGRGCGAVSVPEPPAALPAPGELGTAGEACSGSSLLLRSSPGAWREVRQALVELNLILHAKLQEFPI